MNYAANPLSVSQNAEHPGRHRLESQPSSRTGENSPYGMIGGIEETSASFEARSAPRSYPTRRSRETRFNRGTKEGHDSIVRLPHRIRPAGFDRASRCPKQGAVRC